MKIVIGFLLGIVSTVACSMLKETGVITDGEDKEVRKGKYYTQTISYSDGLIQHIRIDRVQSPWKQEQGSYVVSQDVTFDARGVFDSLHYFNCYKETDTGENGIIGSYCRGNLYLDSTGYIQDLYLPKRSGEIISFKAP